MNEVWRSTFLQSKNGIKFLDVGSKIIKKEEGGGREVPEDFVPTKR